MINIIIADDHEIVREGLKRIISSYSDYTIAAEAQSGKELMQILKSTKCDLIILDISMPDKDGINTLKDIKLIYPDIPILILSMYPEEHYAIRVLKEGASGYLSKDNITSTIILAIKKIIAGGKYISSNVAESLASRLDNKKGKLLHESLSNREFEIMCLIAQGNTAKEIANQLNLSVKTVSTHRSRLLEKMNMKSNAEITHYAIKNSLV